MTDLGTFAGGYYSQAYGINDQSQVVGYSNIAGDSTDEAFRWQDGVMSYLGSLNGQSQADGINDQGQVVGYADFVDYSRRAFLWQDGVMTDLGALAGSAGEAYAINDQGQVVGYFYLTCCSVHASLWQDGIMTDLNDQLSNGAGWTLTNATGINANGWIVGYGKNPNGLTRAFLLTADQASAAADLTRFAVVLAPATPSPRALVEGDLLPAPEPGSQAAPPQALTGQPVAPSTSPALKPLVQARQAQDAGLEVWGDPLVLVLPLN
jgi:probable HAF family extracellular repeat protein